MHRVAHKMHLLLDLFSLVQIDLEWKTHVDNEPWWCEMHPARMHEMTLAREFVCVPDVELIVHHSERIYPLQNAQCHF